MNPKVARRSREWLRAFVRLGARARVDSVQMSDIERQEDTVLRALDLLERQPGVILADEVGMGKTFEALGVVAAIRHDNPRARVLVLTPGPDLNSKWEQEFRRFSDAEHLMHDFGDDVRAVTRLADFAQVARDGRVIVAPMSAFTSTRGGNDQSYLISLFVYWLREQGLPVDGRTASALFRRFRGGELDRSDVAGELFLGHFAFEEVKRSLPGVFRAGGEEGDAPGLYELYANEGLEAFAIEDRVRRALDLARFRLLRKLLPPWNLVIIDEAHKLKNAATVRSQAVATLLRRRFEKALFLTATPFQLEVSELSQVFRLFSLARTAPEDLMAQAERLLADVRTYQEAYTAFEAVWRRLDAEAADRFRQIYEATPDVSGCSEDPILDPVAKRLAELRRLKRERIEPHFRKWMIRSIRRDRRAYRQHLTRRLAPKGPDALPFLLGERLIAELFRVGDGTHKPAAQVSLVSSYGAARRGALLSRATRPMSGDAEEYRGLLRRVLGRIHRNGEHPKLTSVVKDALEHAARGEKTLIFCARLQTLSELSGEIKDEWLKRMLDRWKSVFPRLRRDEIFDEEESGKRVRGRHTLLQARMHRPQEPLHLALRERYLSSPPIVSAWAVSNASRVAGRAQEILGSCRVGRTSAQRPDYRLAKRCVEHAAALLWLEQSRADAAASFESALAPLLDEAYVSTGFDLIPNDEDDSEPGAYRPQWRIKAADIRLLVGSGRDLWARLRPELDKLAPPDRVRLVEQVAHFLTFKEVSFLIDVLAEAKDRGIAVDPPKAKALLNFLDEFWDTEPGQRWLSRLSEFVHYFHSRNASQREDILKGPIRTGEIVRQTKDGESRERLREAFNTPLYPMVLVANEVMQEGLDLHRHCSRVVHHDLAWNPAQLEQRVGRIDRIGSHTAQRLATDAAATLDILYPLIDRTIDVRMYRRVKSREKWLEFLLGATPTFREDIVEDEDVPELPRGLAEELAIDLGPAHRP